MRSSPSILPQLPWLTTHLLWYTCCQLKKTRRALLVGSKLSKRQPLHLPNPNALPPKKVSACLLLHVVDRQKKKGGSCVSASTTAQTFSPKSSKAAACCLLHEASGQKSKQEANRLRHFFSPCLHGQESLFPSPFQ